MNPSAQTAGGRRVARWTRESIIAKILDWNERYGAPPCSADWNPSLARWRAQEWRAERYREGIWPSTNAAKRPFGGSFDEAVRAAGLTPHRPGPRRAPLEARPDVSQRAPLARRDVADELVEAGRRAALAEARAALERRLDEGPGGLRGGAPPREARGSQAARARRSRDRARQEAETAARRPSRPRRGRSRTPTRGCARRRTRAGRPLRDAAAERARAVAAEHRLAGLEGSGPRRGPGPAQIARLREGGPSGPAVLGRALRRLAAARATGDRAGLTRALGDVASAAVRWRDSL